MAKPIEPTPVLEGEDAIRLLKDVDRVSYDENKAKFLKGCVDIFNKTRK